MSAPGTVGRLHQFTIVYKAVAFALAVAGVKALVHARGWEFVVTLPLLTALMGAVVFTLAILLAGVLTDFKESERIVGELATYVRRLHYDFALIAQGERLAALRADLLALSRAINEQLRRGEAWHAREVYARLEALDRGLVDAAKVVGSNSAVRTIQVGLGNIARIGDRIEVIMETTFTKAGYMFAGTVVTAAVAGLVFAVLEPFMQGLALAGFAAFLLSGILLLVYDLDNPYAGAVRVSTRQMEKVERQLTALAAAGQGPASEATR